MAIQLSKRFLVVSITIVTFCLAFAPCLTNGQLRSIVDVIRDEPRLRKAEEWASQTGLLDSLNVGQYGDKVTLIVPSNEAFSRMERFQSRRKEHLLENDEDLETLILFAATDHILDRDDIQSGLYDEPESIVSLLSEYSSISPDGELCVSQDMRSFSCDEEPCCGKMNLNSFFEARDGVIYTIDQVLLPDELIFKLRELEK